MPAFDEFSWSTLHYREPYSPKAGITLVGIRSIANGGPTDRVSMTLAKDIDPCVDDDVATLPIAPFGWNPLDTTTANGKLTLEATPELSQSLTQLEDAVLATAVERGEAWFGKPITREEAERSMTKLVKFPPPEKAQYKPTFGIKITKEGDDPTRVMVVDGVDGDACKYHPGKIADVRPRNRVLAVVEVAHVWFMRSGAWGITLSCTDLTTWPTSTRKRGIDAFGDMFKSKMRASTSTELADEEEFNEEAA